MSERFVEQSEIGAGSAITVIRRSLRFISPFKWQFSVKLALLLFGALPGLLLPWPIKILIDNVILQRPFGETSVVYPPFMNPILNLIDGLDPMGIMLVLTIIYAIMLFTIGSRMGGTGAGLLQGQDAATQATPAAPAPKQTIRTLSRVFSANCKALSKPAATTIAVPC